MIEEKERIKMSFSFAADVAKQLIALSTAIITLCVALADKLFSSQAIKSNSVWLLIALGLFVISIIFGLLCMMAITGTLGKPVAEPKTTENAGEGERQPTRQETETPDHDLNEGTIYQSNISTLMKTQNFIFLAGVFMSVVFLCFASCSKSEQKPQPSKKAEDRTNAIRVERLSNYTVLDSVMVDTLLIKAN